MSPQSQPADLAPQTADANSRSALATFFQWLAPVVVMAALAYPSLVWPLFEAEIVSLGPRREAEERQGLEGRSDSERAN